MTTRPNHFKKVVITIFLCFFQLILAQKINSKDLLLEIKNYTVKKTKNVNYVRVSICLTNVSKDSVTYLSKSCSYDDFYFLNEKKLSIQGIECDKNIGIFLTLAPNESRTEKLTLIAQDGLKLVHFRIGFDLVHIPKRVTISTHDYKKQEILKLWSNKVKVSLE